MGEEPVTSEALCDIARQINPDADMSPQAMNEHVNKKIDLIYEVNQEILYRMLISGGRTALYVLTDYNEFRGALLFLPRVTHILLPEQEKEKGENRRKIV